MTSGAGPTASAAAAPTPAPRSRWRRITAGVLLGLAILAIILAPIMLYVRAEFLDSANFRDRAETALASPDVQAYVTDAITANLVARGGTDAQRAEPLIHAVVGGVVGSDRFQPVFARAAAALQARVLSGGAAARVIKLQSAVTRVADAVAVVSPALAQRIRSASGEFVVGKGETGRRLAEIAHLAHQLRVLGIILPIIAFVLLALSIAVAQDRLRATRRAGWGLIAGGIVVSIVAGLTHRILTGVVSDPEASRAVGAAENAFLGDLGTWGVWVIAIGVVTLGTAVFLGSPLTLREHIARRWDATTSRPASAWGIVLRVVAVVVVVLLAIFALDALLRILIGVGIGLAVAYAVAELLRLAGVGAQRPTGTAAVS